MTPEEIREAHCVLIDWKGLLFTKLFVKNVYISLSFFFLMLLLQIVFTLLILLSLTNCCLRGFLFICLWLISGKLAQALTFSAVSSTADETGAVIQYFFTTCKIGSPRWVTASQFQVSVEMGVLCFLHCWKDTSGWGEGKKPNRIILQNNLLLNISYLYTACSLQIYGCDRTFYAITFLCKSTLS